MIGKIILRKLIHRHWTRRRRTFWCGWGLDDGRALRIEISCQRICGSYSRIRPFFGTVSFQCRRLPNVSLVFHGNTGWRQITPWRPNCHTTFVRSQQRQNERFRWRLEHLKEFGFFRENASVLSISAQTTSFAYGTSDPTKSTPTSRTIFVESNSPDKCDTDFDAVAVIRGEMWAFKSRHFWRIHRDRGEQGIVPPILK